MEKNSSVQQIKAEVSDVQKWMILMERYLDKTLLDNMKGLSVYAAAIFYTFLFMHPCVG